MGPSHRQQLSTEEILAGRDNEEETVRGRGTICPFLSSSSQGSREGDEEETGPGPREQRSLRTFSDKKLRRRKHVTGSELPGSRSTLSCMKIRSSPSTLRPSKKTMTFLKGTL